MSFDFRIVNGDFQVGQNGDLARVENTEKLVQDILKIAITPLGSNQFFPWYGSPITRSLVGSALDAEFLSSIATAQLQSSLENLQKLQQAQARQQRVTPFEQLAGLREVRIERNNVDPRYFVVIIDALTRALSEVRTGFEVKPTL